MCPCTPLTPLSQVERQVFTSLRAFVSTNCCELRPWQHKGSTWIRNSTVFNVMYLQRMSTSQLYAHHFVNMCKIYWLLLHCMEIYLKLFKFSFSRSLATGLSTRPASARSPLVRRCLLICDGGVYSRGRRLTLSRIIPAVTEMSWIFCTFVDSPEPHGRTPHARRLCKDSHRCKWD